MANRGEIAVRIIRSARERGIRAIAVYSEPDRLAPHVLAADEAYHIGPAPSSESYLRTEGLIEVAKATGADAIHPGYGFLSERSSFAKAVEDEGLIFIGPSSEVIEVMGDKIQARRYMQDAGIPVIPGITEPVSTPEAAIEIAHEIGFPVLVKAAAGGGGKGMRVVEEPGELTAAFETAQREALSAFGDGTLYLEQALKQPRHIEVQILADTQGSVLHLGERECSIQRRHQKLVEEAPATALSTAERESIGRTAVQAATAIGYTGAGTVEFLYEDGNYYFLEMNTRIQVEHPVTELVTGVDLVDWQIRIASGEALDFTQEDVRISGHAIECRITAENPRMGLLPSTGIVTHLELPTGAGVRWDGGIREGSHISQYYDPLLGKLIVHANTREAAIERMARALDELVLLGVENCASLQRRVMDEPDFKRGHLSIRYLQEHPDLLNESPVDPEVIRSIAIAGALLEAKDEQRTRLARTSPNLSRWQSEGMSSKSPRT